MAKVTIDGIEIEVPDGTTILNAARKIGGNIVPPAMCYYTPIKGTGGKCRACLVKVAAGSAKDPRPMPKLVPSCITTVQDGMVVENTPSYALAASPAQFDEQAPTLTPAPGHGEHTEEVLLALGKTWDEILELKVSGAIL